MKVFASTGTENVATVYLAQMGNTKMVEFVESVQPPLPRDKKWVLIISTLFGCPVKCIMCDAGIDYKGKLTCEEIFEQIDFLVKKRFPQNIIPVKKFKIQFARMGEPSYNHHVLQVLEQLPQRYQAPGLIPTLSTIAPMGTDNFFSQLITIKNKLYPNGQFQLQFSIHSTSEHARDIIIPVKKWNLEKIGLFGEKFYQPGDRKITLNFALLNNVPINPDVLSKYFSPDKFLVKITPVNPTYQALNNNINSYIDINRNDDNYTVIQDIRSLGYEVIMSIGEVEENYIGSNCGQFMIKHLQENIPLDNGYSYALDQNLPPI